MLLPTLSLLVAMMVLSMGWLGSTGRGLKRGLWRSLAEVRARPSSCQDTCQDTWVRVPEASRRWGSGGGAHLGQLAAPLAGAQEVQEVPGARDTGGRHSMLARTYINFGILTHTPVFLTPKIP